jgi:hypothetical protein
MFIAKPIIPDGIGDISPPEGRSVAEGTHRIIN